MVVVLIGEEGRRDRVVIEEKEIGSSSLCCGNKVMP